MSDNDLPRGLSDGVLARLLLLGIYCLMAGSLTFGSLPPQRGCGTGLFALIMLLWVPAPVALLSAILDLLP